MESDIGTEHGSDSGFDSHRDSDILSITSSNYAHKMIHGRRFHGIEHNPYPLPNDEEEFGRLKNLHNALRDILDGNVLAPITPGATNILDVGCGSGHWCIEVANQFPSAAVKGIDLSPIQPELVPLNVDFIVADLNEGLYFDEGSHDLVQSRIITAGVTMEQWPMYMKEVYRILKPGNGWVQCIESTLLQCDDGSVPDSSAYWKVQAVIKKNLSAHFLSGEHLEKTIKGAGFVDVTLRKVKVHMGKWGPDPRKHECESLMQSAWTGAYPSLISKFMAEDFPDDKARDKFIRQVMADVENPEYHFHTILYVVTGRKPELA